MATPTLPEEVRPQDAVLLYDGLCGFCDGTVRWLLRHDHGKRIFFTTQQSELSQAVLSRYGLHVATNTVYLIIDPGTGKERVLERSDAILFALALLGRAWKLVAAALRLLPRGLRDAVYAAVARNRYRIAGKRAECRIPTPQERSRFLGL